jgi:hypothetical protein
MGSDYAFVELGPLTGPVFIPQMIYEWTSTMSTVLLRGNWNRCLHFLSIFIARKLTIDLIIDKYLWISQKIIIIIIIIPKSNTFANSQTQDSSQLCDLSYRNLIAEKSSLSRSSIVTSFRSMENIFTRTQTQDSFSGLRPLFLWSPRRNKQLRSWRRSSIVLSFQDTDTTLTGFHTQKPFSEFWPF